MNISLSFLAVCLYPENVIVCNESPQFRSDNLEHFTESALHRALYYAAEPEDRRRAFLDAEALRKVGASLVWVSSEEEPPEGLPVLWLRSEAGGRHAEQKIRDVFVRFNSWSSRVYAAALGGAGLQELCEYLNEVTPNAWYVSDASFRIQAIRDDPNVSAMSAIWKFMTENGHLPMSIILKTDRSGILDTMNRARSAYIEGPEPFNFPFVSYTLHSGQGVYGHFYLIGIYNRLGVYETELAEFWGQLLDAVFRGNTSCVPTLGRYFDNYFIDVIHGIESTGSEDICRIISEFSWGTDDRYCVMVSETMSGKAEQAMGLQILTMEENFPCYGFFLDRHVVFIYNLSRQKYPLKEAARHAAKLLHTQIGSSEPFSGTEELAELNSYYEQAVIALTYATRNSSASADQTASLGYQDIAGEYLCRDFTENTDLRLLIHPAMKELRAYDTAHGSELAHTLYCYLVNEQNMTLTADLLYIHRNSLAQRLMRIRELTEIRLDDPYERIRLFLSYMALTGER